MVCSSTSVSVQAKDSQHRQRVQVEGAVREHHALGRAGAAAGVEQFGDGVFVEGDDVGTRDPVAAPAGPRR